MIEDPATINGVQGTVAISAPTPNATETVLAAFTTPPPASEPVRPRDLWIAASSAHAEHLRRALGCRPSGYNRSDPCFVTYPGAPICGLRFHNVILGRETYVSIYSDKRLSDWFELSIRCRMSRHGAILDL